MDSVHVNGVDLAFIDVGHGPTTVVFSHSYLVDHRQFEAQIEDLSADHRVVAFDHRDHGRSQRLDAGYGMYDLVDDAEALLDELGVARCHFVGLSTGGFVGMRLAFRSPELFASLTLMDTSASTDRGLRRVRNTAMVAALGVVGTAPLMPFAMRTMFSTRFLRDRSRREEVEAWRSRIKANDADALRRFAGAIFSRDDVSSQIDRIRAPTLVVTGGEDRALPVDDARMLAATIPGADLVVVEEAGHLCTIERPGEVTAALRAFVTSF